ncbi:MAG: FkbM family methyltransferase [Terriglobales bacterium]
MNVAEFLQKILMAGVTPALFKAILTWPHFSLTSYAMVRSLARQGVRPRTVIDVGANVGQFAVAAAKIFPGAQVHSFEPQPQCVLRLQTYAPRLPIKVYPVGLGEKREQLPFHQNTHSHSSSFLPLGAGHREAFPGARTSGTEMLALSTLDDELRDIEWVRPALLKLDVQGFEAQVLRGGRQSLAKVDFVVLEASLTPLYEGEMLFEGLLELMRSLGFRFLRPVGWITSPETSEILQIDALFERSLTA